MFSDNFNFNEFTFILLRNKNVLYVLFTGFSRVYMLFRYTSYLVHGVSMECILNISLLTLCISILSK